MKIAIAQSRPIVGSVEQNLANHLALIDIAVNNGSGLVVFPELSLTGYEPQIADDCKRSPNDSCFTCLQTVADRQRVSIAVGVPTPGDRLARISTLLFQPTAEVSIYSKQFLHPHEESFFEAGPPANGLIHQSPTVALAICYELSISAHAQRAFDHSASVYIASVAKTACGVDDASQRLLNIARHYSSTVMMANCLGDLDGAECVGKSSAWNSNGQLVARLGTQLQGVIVFDLKTQDVVIENLRDCQQ